MQARAATSWVVTALVASTAQPTRGRYTHELQRCTLSLPRAVVQAHGEALFGIGFIDLTETPTSGAVPFMMVGKKKRKTKIQK